MIQYYVIPSKVNYVQFISDIITWERTDRIDPNVPTVALIMDSLATEWKRFFVVYKNKIQATGGSGSCYNPTKRTSFDNLDPMNNATMPQHMSKWQTFDFSILLKAVAAAKYELIKGMGHNLSTFYWDCDLYHANLGLFIGLLDLIGMGKVDASTIKASYKNRKQVKLLN